MDEVRSSLLMTHEERLVVLQEFPTPIATTCRRLWDAMGLSLSKEYESQNLSVSLSEALQNAFESLLRFCAWTVTSDYLELQQDWSSEKLDHTISQFFKESRRHSRGKTANWMALFKDVLVELLSCSRPLFIKEAAQLGRPNPREEPDEPKAQVDRWFERLESFRRIGDTEKLRELEPVDVDEMLHLFHQILKSVFCLRNYRLLATTAPTVAAPDSFLAVVFQGTTPYDREVSLQRRDRRQEIEKKMTYLVDAANCALRLTPLITLQGTHSICTYVEALDQGDYIYEPGGITMKDEETLRLISHFVKLMDFRQEKSRTQRAITDATVACQENCHEFLRRKQGKGYERKLYQYRKPQETISTFLQRGPTPEGEPFCEPVMVLVGPSGVGKSMLVSDLLANRRSDRLTLAYDAREIKEGIVTAIMKSLGMSGERRPDVLLKRLDAFHRERPDVFGKKKPMAVVVDGLNEAADPDTLFEGIHELASQIEDRPIRILLTSRPTLWRMIQRKWNHNAEFESLYYRSRSDAGGPLSYAVELQPFSLQELHEAYDQYQSQEGSHLPPFAELKREWKAFLRSPFYLPIIASRAREEGRLPDMVSRADAIDEYIRARVGELGGKDTGTNVSLSNVRGVLIRLAKLMLEHHCLSIRRAPGEHGIKEAIRAILYESGDSYALAIDVGIIEERGSRFGAFEIHFTHEQFTERFIAEALRSELDSTACPPNEQARRMAKRMAELLADANMTAVLSGAFVTLISTVKDPAFVELLLRSLARHDAPEISDVMVNSLLCLCEQDWRNGEPILRAMMAGSPHLGLSILPNAIRSLRNLVKRDVAAQDHPKTAANTSNRCRCAAVEAGTLVEGNQPNAFLIDAMQNRSAIVRNFAVDLVSGRWCGAVAEERELFLADLAAALEFPEAGMMHTLWHAFRKRHLLESGARFLFASYIDDVHDTERSREILDCCQHILRKVPSRLLPRLSKLLVRPAFFVIKRCCIIPFRSIAKLWDKGNVEKSMWLSKFIDPCVLPEADALDHMDQILLHGGSDIKQLGMRWLASCAYQGYAVHKPKEAALHFGQLLDTGDAFVRYWMLVPACTGWAKNRSPELKAFVEETCWRIITDWRQEMYVAKKPWFTRESHPRPLGLYSGRVVEDPSAPLPVFRKAMEEFWAERRDPVMVTHLLDDVAPWLLAFPDSVLSVLQSYPELVQLPFAPAAGDDNSELGLLATQLCKLLATLRLSSPRALEDFLEINEPSASFISRLHGTGPNLKYLDASFNLRVGKSTTDVLFSSSALGRWCINVMQAAGDEGSMHKHVAHFAADVIACVKAGSLAQSDFMIAGKRGQG